MKLTLPQQDVYFEQLLYPGDPIYNIGAKISIKGSILYEALNEAYIMLINQHDAYRSMINHLGNDIEIEIREEHGTFLEYADFSAYANNEVLAEEFMQKRFQVAFNLHDKQLLHKFILVKVSDAFYYLFSVYHHIITDGWGTSLMFQRLVKNYNEIVGLGKVTTEYNYSYLDFVKDDEAYFQSGEYTTDKLYWTEKFRQLPEQMFTVMEDTGKPNQSSRKELVVKRAVYNKLEQLGKGLGCSTFQVILGVLYLYFGRKHQNTDFAIGIPTLNRGKSVFKKTVGLFMGISPLRVPFTVNDSFEELVKRIRQQLRQDYRHQRFPLGKLIKELQLFREKDRLFNITLSYEKQDYADHFANTETKVIPLSHHAERVALAIYIREFDELEDVKIDFDYNLNYFDLPSVTRLVTHIETLLEAVIDDPQKTVAAYEYITPGEKEQLLAGFNQTQFNYPVETTLIGLFNRQVKKYPHKPAVKDEERQYSYAELDQLSDKIAMYLQAINGDKPSPIAVLMNRSAKLVATLLGILKSGNAYIPLDPSFPKDRLEYIIQHSGAQQIISAPDVHSNLAVNGTMLDIEEILSEEFPARKNELKTVPVEHTAYIIYTSGSTGAPKGVAIGHKALLNFLVSMHHQPGITNEDLLYSVTTQSFDISILEFFAPLTCGATVYIASPEILSDPVGIVEQIGKLQPSVIQATPSFYQMLYNAGWKGDKRVKILCGGDLLSEILAVKLLQANAGLWNMYGPTETTIWSACKRITNTGEAANIGKPINNTECYILDECLQLLPIGSTGTIYIGGDGLAKGYFNNEELTGERFIKSPFDNNKRIYNTGDLGRWNENGEIVFLGRNDNQVKIRGYRIEPGEIEAKLNQLENIRSSVVVAQKTTEKLESLLIAFVIMGTGELDDAAILKELRKELPEYMIPQAIIALGEFPLTPNRKIDRKALAAHKIMFTSKPASPEEEPATATEIQLYNFYKETLALNEKISVTDSYFSLGGHSLNAVKLINLVNEQLRCSITLRDIFNNPSIQALAKCIEHKGVQQNTYIPPVAESTYYEITPAQHSIWLASLQEHRSIAYNMAAAFHINGQIHKTVLTQVFAEMLEQYEVLRTRFVEKGGKPYQKVLAKEEAGIAIDECYCDGEKTAERVQSYIDREFDLANETLLRVALFYDEFDHGRLVFCTHHIIMDGWSIEILINEIIKRYRAIEQQEELKEEQPDFQFRDYAAWLQAQSVNAHEKNLEFWNTYLEQYSWKNHIPPDNEKAGEISRTATGNYCYRSVQSSALNVFAHKHGVSLHTLLVGAFNILLSKMYGHEDICIATVNSGRTISALHHQPGMFVKTLPLRTRINPGSTLVALLKSIQYDILMIDGHQDIPEPIMHTIRPDILVVMENPSFNYNTITINEKVQLQSCPVNTSYARLPLLISFSVSNNTVSGAFNYNAALYDSDTIELVNIKYEKLLNMIIEDPYKTIGALNLEVAMESKSTIDISFDF